MNLHLLQKRVVSYQIPFDSDYQAILDRAVFLGYDLPSSDQQKKQNQLLIDLKTAGIWNKLDVFYLFANNGGADFARLEWKNPLVRECNIIGSINFLSDIGFKGTGSGNYLQTGFRGIEGVNFTLNNASYYTYFYELGSTGTVLQSQGTRETIYIQDLAQQRINSNLNNLNALFLYTNVRQLKGINRISSTEVVLYNGKTGATRTQNSVGLRAPQIDLFTVNASSGTSDPTLSSWSAGASLVSENDDYCDIMDAYINSL